MHMEVSCIVKATTKKEAEGEAEEFMNEYFGEGRTFDYGIPTKDSDRYNTPTVRLSSKEGTALIKKKWRWSSDSILKDIVRSRNVMATHTDEEILQSSYLKFEIRVDGAYNCFIYEQGWGGEINSEEGLKSAMGEPKKKWVVNFDVHY